MREVMRKLFLFSLIAVFVFSSSSVFAQMRGPSRAPLGFGNFALKVDYIDFTDGDLKDLNADTAAYVGIEGYGLIAPNFYLGTEIGYANPDGRVNDAFFGHIDTDVTFAPIELNLKYAVNAGTNLVIDFGAGVSTTYVEVEQTVSTPDFVAFVSDNDWLFGGQFFVDMYYTTNQFFIGINAKYHATEDFQDFVNLSNWRVGGQIGLRF
jgi:hypothetical protein